MKEGKRGWHSRVAALLVAVLILPFNLTVWTGGDASRGDEVWSAAQAVEAIPAERVEITFSRPVKDRSVTGVQMWPVVPIEVSWQADGQRLVVTPRAALEAGQKHTVLLTGLRDAAGDLMTIVRIDSCTFNADTEAVEVVQTEPERFREALIANKIVMDKPVPKPAPVPAPAVAPTAPAAAQPAPAAAQPAPATPRITDAPNPYRTTGRYIDISIAKQKMTLFQDGVPVEQFLVSTGKRATPTPLGVFSVKNKERNHWSRTYKLWMPFSLQFSGPYFIHDWPSGYREGANHLGYRVSHGCVRLGVGAAEYVYNWSSIGTIVYIHN